MGQAMKIRDDFREIRETRPSEYGLQNALAAYVRQHSPAHSVQWAIHTFGLTEGEARGLVYANTTLRTLNKALKAGGWSLWLWLGAHLFQRGLEHHLEQERKRHADRATKLAQIIGGLQHSPIGLDGAGPGVADRKSFRRPEQSFLDDEHPL